MWIEVKKDDLNVVEVNWPINFKTWSFVATVFILHISLEVAEVIKNRDNVVIWKIEDFRNLLDWSFVFEKKIFLDMVWRALDYEY